MRNLERRKNKRNLVTLTINDVHQLQSWYMPFITNGVQTDADNVAKDKIETHLAGAQGAVGGTATM